jgi:hypothetical protein
MYSLIQFIAHPQNQLKGSENYQNFKTRHQSVSPPFTSCETATLLIYENFSLAELRESMILLP